MNTLRRLAEPCGILPRNERKKAAYAAWLEKALGKQPVTVDAVLKAIERFEIATSFKPFRNFHRAQVLAFREKLAEEVGRRPTSECGHHHSDAEEPSRLFPLAFA